MTYDSARAIFPILPLPPEPDTAVLRGASSVHPRAGGRRSRTFRRAILESRSDVVFDYDQRTSAEDLVPVLPSLSGSASTPHDPHPMAPGEWNGNHNDRAFPMVGVPA